MGCDAGVGRGGDLRGCVRREGGGSGVGASGKGRSESRVEEDIAAFELGSDFFGVFDLKLTQPILL